jgi:ribosomal protein S18 acetylase RimI-like enzyme
MVYRLISSKDARLLASPADGVFDHDVRPELCSQFLSDPRHHMAVAVEDSTLVGFASAVNYIHPDKPDELWINEVSVAEPYRRKGVAEALLRLLLQRGRELGCTEAWVLTDESNVPANRLYSELGGTPTKPVMYSFRIGDDDGE